ncbi:hypothetical protein F1559_002536 [Cyanidiococcus yangmingshanensis]|uniref:Uncharacterized protein n=1 Tax=Cyanidiococcus yangmingshanensis TaxID=2690220 RepID=A0A7J7IM01_9RHOD|nr:hypothetical protein F1559_002536 [Cyanidiococcus yangmingshanensis]
MTEQAMTGCYQPGDAQNRRSSDGFPHALQHSSDDVPRGLRHAMFGVVWSAGCARLARRCGARECTSCWRDTISTSYDSGIPGSIGVGRYRGPTRRCSIRSCWSGTPSWSRGTPNRDLPHCWRFEPLEHHAHMVIAMHPEGVLCATSANTPVLLWDLRTPDTIARLPAGLGATRETNGVLQIEFALNGHSIGIRSNDGSMIIYDLRKRLCIESVRNCADAPPKKPGRGSCFAFHPSGLCVAASFREPAGYVTMRLLSLRNAAVTKRLQPLAGSTKYGWICASWDVASDRLTAIPSNGLDMSAWLCNRTGLLSIW